MDVLSQLKNIEKLLELRHTAEAKKLLDGIIAVEPNNSEAWYWNGVCDKLDGNLMNAEASFKKVLEFSPNHYLSLYGLGLILESRGEIPNAIEAFRHAFEINPAFTHVQKKLEQYHAGLPKQKTEPITVGGQESKYSKLTFLLKNRKWKEADMETADILRGLSAQNWTEIDAIQKAPQQDLLELDRLWTEGSEGRFGFSIQMKIYKGVGGLVTAEDVNPTIFDWYIRRVGWHIMKNKGFRKVGSALMSKKQIMHSLSAPLGHLPAAWLLPNKNLLLEPPNAEKTGWFMKIYTTFWYIVWFAFCTGFLSVIGGLVTQDDVGVIVGIIIGVLIGLQLPIGYFSVKREMKITSMTHKKMLALFSHFDK